MTMADRMSVRAALAAAAVLMAFSPGAASAQVSDVYAREVEVRLSEMEIQMRTLTGRIEELQFQVDQLQGRLDAALNDIEFRLQLLEGNSPVAGVPGTAPAPTAPDPATTPAPAPQPAPVAPTTAAPATDAPVGQTYDQILALSGDQAPAGQGTLGTLQGSGSDPIPAQPLQGTPAGAQAAAAVALPAGDPQTQYDYAFGILQSGNYTDAETAFRSFLAANPNHSLASNAQYWLGETFYVRGRFGEAAEAFSSGYRQVPDGSKVVDSLLKLGMSQAAMGQRPTACDTFSRLIADHPNATFAVLRRAEQERDRLQCL